MASSQSSRLPLPSRHRRTSAATKQMASTGQYLITRKTDRLDPASLEVVSVTSIDLFIALVVHRLEYPAEADAPQCFQTRRGWMKIQNVESGVRLETLSGKN